MELNNIQKQAVNSLDTNINLIAGAGTGKTRVLTTRFVNIVKKTNNIDRVLAITFTKKAAEEMSSRISDELINSDIHFDENQLNIKTIHSFCQELVSEYSSILNLNPKFEIIEEENADKLLEEATTSILLNSKDRSFFKYLTDFKSSVFQEIKVFKDIYYKFKNMNLEYEDIYYKTVKPRELVYSQKDLVKELISLSNIITAGKFKKFKNTEEFNNIISGKDITSEDLDLIEENLGNSKKFSEKIDLIKLQINDLRSDYENKNYEYYKIIITILKKIDNKYHELKNNLNFLDYDDLMIYTSKLLKLEVIAEHLKSKYKYILVDEYQDTNPLQNKIVSYFEKSNLFIVGDPKQSIYGFRGSDISSYFDFANKIEESGQTLNMNINYRTDLIIINTINEIFKSLMNYYEPIESNLDTNGKISVYPSEDLESLIILVKDLLKEYKIQNIAILTRSNNQVIEITKLLQKEDISFNTGSKSLKQIEILNLISRIIDVVYNPEDNIKLLSLLNEPILKLYFSDLLEVLLSNDISFDKMKRINDNIRLEKFIRFIDNLILDKDKLHLDEIVAAIANWIHNIRTLTKIEYEYIFELQKTTEEFVNKYGDDFRLYKNYLDLKEFDDLEKGINVLTIHKSKGLEYEVVIIANMDKNPIMTIRDKIIVDEDLGLGIKSDYSVSNYNSIISKIQETQKEEEKRILYVAMTRAKKELVLFGNFKKASSGSYFSMIKSSGVELDEYKYKDIDKNIKNDNKFELINFQNRKDYRIREYYTVSDYLNYRRSPIDFYNKYFLGIDDYTIGNNSYRVIDPKLLGTIVHYFAQYYSKNTTSEKDIDNFIERTFISLEEELTFDKIKLVKELCHNYLLMEEDEVIYKELLFYYNLNGYLVKGYIDSVVKIDGNYYIVDLKTNQADENYLIETYRPQVLIYSKIFESLYNIKVKGAYIYDLRGRNKLRIDIDESEIVSFMKEFSDFIEFTRSHIIYDDYL